MGEFLGGLRRAGDCNRDCSHLVLSPAAAMRFLQPERFSVVPCTDSRQTASDEFWGYTNLGSESTCETTTDSSPIGWLRGNRDGNVGCSSSSDAPEVAAATHDTTTGGTRANVGGI